MRTDFYRDLGLALVKRIEASGYARMTRDGIPSAWLAKSVSQILAITGDDPIIYVGHTLQDYDHSKVKDLSEDPAEGKIQVLTNDLLVVSEFTGQGANTRVTPLTRINSISVGKVRDVTTKGLANWPDHVSFELEFPDATYTFPPVDATASHSEFLKLPSALRAVTAALARG